MRYKIKKLIKVLKFSTELEFTLFQVGLDTYTMLVSVKHWLCIYDKLMQELMTVW